MHLAQMNSADSARQDRELSPKGGERAFTLIELLVVIALIAILASILLPVFGKAKARAQGIACLNNTRQLAVAWLLYADDHADRLPYNLGGDASRSTVAVRTNLNWVNGIMDWSLSADNTNTAMLTEAALGGYANKAISIYRCPSDHVLSSKQREAGWSERVRSYSMNAMIGDAGELSQTGVNTNNPYYVQFFKLSLIPRPSGIFVFLDEHPDSINDGYYLNKVNRNYREWVDLPASYHDGAAAFSFADGHSQIQRWAYARTRQPARPDGAELPLDVPSAEASDYDWVVAHMSVYRR
jgi:prepilin-type N-terminal cleavage/methylation domain-containing protein/prepilin-type processing-associated H-X9-DG protein